MVKAKKLIIDGVEVTQMYSYLFSDNVLTYQKSPARSGTGAISNINDLSYFFVKRLWVEFNYVSLKDYQFILRLINKPEFTIEYFDFESGEYVKGLFYLTPTDRQNINGWGGYFRGVTSYVLSFVGTNNELDKYFIVSYDLNGGSGLIPRQSATSGQEINLSDGKDIYRYGYTLDSWNTRADGLGGRFTLNQKTIITGNLHLYAIWKT